MSENTSKFAIKRPLYLDFADTERTVRILKALSSETRLEIIKKLIEEPMTISQLAKEFYLPMSSMCLHIKILEEAEIIQLKSKPGTRGTSKLCGVTASVISLDFFSHAHKILRKESAFVHMPIGKYTKCEATPPCGLVSSDSRLYYEDSPYGFYLPNHTDASLLWFTSGMLEYTFSNESLKEYPVKYIEFSMELCAEAPGYNNEWPSDIDFELNGKKITTFHIDGDYGGRRGIYTPDWWSDANTQYGELKHIRITPEGCYYDQKLVSQENITSLGLENGYCFTLVLKVDPDAEHIGGMNLFGQKFGDYAQDIIMKVEYL